MLACARFLEAVERDLEPLRGTHIHAAALRDHRLKLGLDGQEYVTWLRALLPWLQEQAGQSRPLRILDVGCGTGELTVLMGRLGHEAWGADVHAEHLALARTLADENGVPPLRFVHTAGAALPFADRSMDVAHLHVVLEHVPDEVLPALLRELRRVVRHGVHVIVPNRLQWIDDHTGLKGVPLLPRPLGEWWVRRRAGDRAYGISAEGRWDVQYRAFPRIRRLAAQAGFQVRFPPDATVYPPAGSEAQLPLHRFHSVSPSRPKRWVWRGIGLAILAWARLRSVPPEGLRQYLNLYLEPDNSPRG